MNCNKYFTKNLFIRELYITSFSPFIFTLTRNEMELFTKYHYVIFVVLPQSCVFFYLLMLLTEMKCSDKDCRDINIMF